ncbi:MAG TPA: hypothetical protein VIR38_10880, partial [Thalassobaculum sp.]
LVRTALRGATTVEVDAAGLRTTGPLARAIRWDDLTGIELRYFATRRDKEGGWMQMKLQGGGRTISLESTLEDFAVVAGRAVGAAASNRLALSQATRENLRALGLAAGGGAPGGEAPDGESPRATGGGVAGPARNGRVGSE